MIVASTTVVIPIPLIIGVTIYLIGVWVTLFFLGLNKFPGELIFIAMAALLWTLFWCCATIVCFGDWCEEVSQRNVHDTARRCLVFVKKFLDFATLPLMPFSFGEKVSNWRSRKDMRNVQ